MCGPQRKGKQASVIKLRVGHARPLTCLRQIAQKTFHSSALPM